MLINAPVKYYGADDPLSAVFAALADPTRRAILRRLRQGEATVNELAQPFNISLPAISRHLSVLQRAGLVSRERRAQWRFYTINPRTMAEISTWVDDYAKLWDEHVDRLEAHLKNDVKK